MSDIEQRKVQLTGGSTYTVSLPKEWAVENQIGAGSLVNFYPEGSSIVLSAEKKNSRNSTSVNIDGMEMDEIVRTVVTMYVSGFEIIELQSGRISTEQRRAVRDITRQLVGIEIIEETPNMMKLKDLLDSSELSIIGAVERMENMALSMFSDSIESIKLNDLNLSKDVIERDDDIDRLWFVVSRAFRTSLKSPSKLQELGLERIDCFDYHTCARQLERIGDHAAKISYIKQELGDIPEPIRKGLGNLHEASREIIDLAIKAMKMEDKNMAKEAANRSRTKVTLIEKLVLEMMHSTVKDLDVSDAQKIGLVLDSVSRCADYGGNIAETVLQKVSPHPEF